MRSAKAFIVGGAVFLSLVLAAGTATADPVDDPCPMATGDATIDGTIEVNAGGSLNTAMTATLGAIDLAIDASAEAAEALDASATALLASSISTVLDLTATGGCPETVQLQPSC